MKILRLISSLNPSGGGPVEAARRIDAELIRLGHQLEVACLDAPGQDYHLEYPAPVNALGPARLGYMYSPRLIPWLRANRVRFDVVVVDGLWQYHSFAAWRAFARTNTPYFVFTHGMLDPWFKLTYPMKHLKKMIYWPWAEYRVLRDARAVLFTCEEEQHLARKSFLLYRCNEVVTAFGTSPPPGDDSGILAEQFRLKHPELRDKRVLLFLGRIHEKKGCDLLIKAFSDFATANVDLHLVVAGPDSAGLSHKLGVLAKSLGLSERITWTGMLQGDDKWGAFYSAEVFCLPSHQENFGIVVAEALGCGKPVLISNKVNIWREIMADGAGLIQDDTLMGTRESLQQWLALTPDVQNKMKISARRCFDVRFRNERAAATLVNILESYSKGQNSPYAMIREGVD